MKNVTARIFILLLSCLIFSQLSGARFATAETYLDPAFQTEVLADLTGELIIGGSLAVGPGGGWGDSVYVLTTPLFPAGTAPEIAKIWKVDRLTGEAAVLTTFPSRFDPDPAKRALAFYTSGRIPPQAVITGELILDSGNLLGPADAAGNPGLYVTSADSGKILKVAPDGTIQLIHNLRAALYLSPYDDPTGMVFSRGSGLRVQLYPDPEWQSGMYVVITGEGYPYSWKLIRYTSLSPLSFSIVTTGTGGGGAAGFAPNLDSAFGPDLYVLSGSGSYHISRVNKSGTIANFSQFDALASSTGIAFSQAGSFGEALYTGVGRSGGISGSIFKTSADGTTSLFASGIGGQGMIFESPDALLAAGDAQIIRITPKSPPYCSQVSAGTIDQACIYDDFNDNTVSGSLWSVAQGGSGPVLSESDQSLQLFFPNNSFDNGQGGFSAGLTSACKLRGDFDVQVDFDLLTWPSANGVRVGLGAAAGVVERTSFGAAVDYPGRPREVYLTHFSDGVLGISSTTDLSGKLRLVRTGSGITGYHYADGTWVAVHTGASDTADSVFSISAWSHDYAFTNQEVKLAFDNVIINKGQLVCNQPPTADAGPAQTIPCGGANGTSVTLNGSKSADPDNDTLTYSWTWAGGSATGVNPTVTLPLGATTVTLTVDDGKGGTSQATVTITVQDAAAPVTTVLSIAGIPGDNEWYRSDVTINLQATDSCSGVKDIHYAIDGVEKAVSGTSASATISGEATHSLSYYAADNAGNKEATYTLTVSIDKTAPTITASVTPLPNANGWNNTDVTIMFTCSDALSGAVSCPAPITVTTEGAGQAISGSVTDKAGNTATATVTVNIDKTAPAVGISADPSVLRPRHHKMVNVKITGSAADSGSGISAVVFTVVDEYGIVQPTISAFDTVIQLRASRKGSDKDGRHYTITAIATDQAGNPSTVSTTVVVPHDKRGHEGEKDDDTHGDDDGQDD